MVLVPLKKSLTLYFVRVCLYCSLRPLMYSMTILVPSKNFPVYGFHFLLECALLKRAVFGSGCPVGLCEDDPFLLQEIQV